MYRLVTDLPALQAYLSGAALVSFDFETAPDEGWRHEPKAALDPHKAHIVGISFSVATASSSEVGGSAVYVPFACVGAIAERLVEMWQWLAAELFANPAVTKIAHNLAFESAFLYQRGIVVQGPVYDTLAAAQMTLKSNTAFRGLGDSGLKTLVRQLFGVELPSFEDVTAGRFFDELDIGDPATLNYACADADYALRLDVTLEQCERIIANLKAGYPALARWQEGTKQKAGARQYVETWLGRRRYLPGITSTDWGKKSFAQRCALNTPIQGTAADMLKLALGRILAGLPERPWLLPLLQIHDELVFEVPEGRVTEAAAFIRQCMTAIGSPALGGQPSGHNPHAGEARLTGQIDEIDVLKERYRQALEYMAWFRPAWNALLEDERFVLTEYFLRGDLKTSAIHSICERFSIERSGAYKRKDVALMRLALLLYGK